MAATEEKLIERVTDEQETGFFLLSFVNQNKINIRNEYTEKIIIK